jgi:hypothetical protein
VLCCAVSCVVVHQIASYLNRLTSDLEAAAYPALDALTSRVTSHNLERVRRIKSRLVRLTTRVENVGGALLLLRLGPVLGDAGWVCIKAGLAAAEGLGCVSRRLA